ncbi:MAG: hypothetical protein J7497_16845, partial [Chitinophagaceae bacterium]|nr:hypothetical protein [Chitinophagaceae bacterium]
MNNTPVSYYIEQYSRGLLTAEERKAFAQLIDDPSRQEELNQLTDETWDILSSGGLHFPEVADRVKLAIKKIQDNETAILPAETVINEITQPKEYRIPSLAGDKHFFRTAWFKYAAAILLIIGLSTYLWNISTKTGEPKTVKTETKKKDILPGGQ